MHSREVLFCSKWNVLPTTSLFSVGATCTICNVLHDWSREQKNEQRNNIPTQKNNAAVSYKSRVKMQLLILKGEGLLFDWAVWLIKTESLFFNISKTKRNISLARYGTWTHDPQIKSLMLYQLS